MSLITILGMVLVICLVIYLTRLMLNAFEVPNPWNTLIFVVVVLLVVLSFLKYLHVPLPGL